MTIHQSINGKGMREQDRAFHFSGLHNNRHVLSKQTVAWHRHFERELKLNKHPR